MRRLLAIVVLLLAGCSSAPSVAATAPTTVPPANGAATGMLATMRAYASSVLATSKCVDVFKRGKRIAVTGSQVNCLDPDGTLVITPAVLCNDGKHLGSIEPSSGAPRGWFLAPGPFVVAKGSIAKDKAYAAAYDRCYGLTPSST